MQRASLSNWLRWEGDLCELRLDSSAVRFFTEQESKISNGDFLRGSNRTLLRYVQGLTLVTLVHTDLIPRLGSHESGADFVPMICSSVSFDADTMHKLRHDFVQEAEIEIRQVIMLIHFRVLNGITKGLPSELTRSIRFFRGLGSVLRWGLWSISVYQMTSIGGWKPSHSSQDSIWTILPHVFCALIQPFLLLSVGWLAPYALLRLLGHCIKAKLQVARKSWHYDPTQS